MRVAGVGGKYRNGVGGEDGLKPLSAGGDRPPLGDDDLVDGVVTEAPDVPGIRERWKDAFDRRVGVGGRLDDDLGVEEFEVERVGRQPTLDGLEQASDVVAEWHGPVVMTLLTSSS